MKILTGRIFWLILVLLVGAAALVAMQPHPVAVDTAVAGRGPMTVTVQDDGRTRIRDRYVVSAPLPGRLVRITLKPGDRVKARESVLATIEPTDPTLLDPRALAQAKARVRAAETRIKLAGARLASAKEALQHAETELARTRKLYERQATTEEDLDRRELAFQQASHEYSAASFEQEVAAFELEVARAALLKPDSEDATDDSDKWSFPIRSPISGQVLQVFQESSTVVNAGERILELGDPQDLEVVVDLLSTDAVRISPGADVVLSDWGGPHELHGSVRLVEPAAFTKVSALGIEEQRVNVIIDFKEPPEQRTGLGHGFRVKAAVVLWSAQDVLKVPAGALFRSGNDWAVFVVRGNVARKQIIQVGHRNDDFAQVLDGLKEHDAVILYPGDRIEDGTRIEIHRPAE